MVEVCKWIDGCWSVGEVGTRRFNELHFSRHRRVPAARCSIFTVKTVAQVRGHACATSRDYETATQATTASDVLFYRVM